VLSDSVPDEIEKLERLEKQGQSPTQSSRLRGPGLFNDRRDAKAGMLVSPIAVLSLLAIATVAAAPAIAGERYQCYSRCTARCAAKYSCERRNASPNYFTKRPPRASAARSIGRASVPTAA
jgi:hypothetical protein